MSLPYSAHQLCPRRGGKAEQGSGMVLPFDPMTMTFKDLHYFVPIPKVSTHPWLWKAFCPSPTGTSPQKQVIPAVCLITVAGTADR